MDGSSPHLAAAELKHLQHAGMVLAAGPIAARCKFAGAPQINSVVPEQRRREDAWDCSLQVQNDLGIAVWIEASHCVAIEQIEIAVLSTKQCQVWVRTRLVGEQHYSRGPQVGV